MKMFLFFNQFFSKEFFQEYHLSVKQLDSDQARHFIGRPVYIESRVCVVKDVVKCSFEYLCVVHYI